MPSSKIVINFEGCDLSFTSNAEGLFIKITPVTVPTTSHTSRSSIITPITQPTITIQTPSVMDCTHLSYQPHGLMYNAAQFQYAQTPRLHHQPPNNPMMPSNPNTHFQPVRQPRPIVFSGNNPHHELTTPSDESDIKNDNEKPPASSPLRQFVESQ